MTDPGTQLDTLFARYDPALAAFGRALRERMRARLPGLTEIVYMYEGQGALVISYSPTGQGYGGVCSTAIRPDGARLHFAHGADLSKADPKKLLRGSGKGVRHVALDSLADFDRPEVEVLIAAALDLAGLRLDANAPGGIVFRVESQKRRALRARKPGSGG